MTGSGRRERSEVALEILEAAWSARRRSFELPEGERRAALTSIRDDLDRAVEMLRGTDHTVHYAHALHLCAHVAMDVGDTEGAEARWREAVEVLRSSGAPLQLAHKVRHLGDLELARENLDEAGGHYAEALTLRREHGNKCDLEFANLQRRIAVLAEKKGDGAEARASWREARQVYAELGVAEGVAEADERLNALA